MKIVLNLSDEFDNVVVKWVRLQGHEQAAFANRHTDEKLDASGIVWLLGKDNVRFSEEANLSEKQFESDSEGKTNAREQDTNEKDGDNKEARSGISELKAMENARAREDAMWELPDKVLGVRKKTREEMQQDEHSEVEKNSAAKDTKSSERHQTRVKDHSMPQESADKHEDHTVDATTTDQHSNLILQKLRDALNPEDIFSLLNIVGGIRSEDFVKAPKRPKNDKGE